MELFLRYNACTYGIFNVDCLYAYRPWKLVDGLFNFGNECIDSFLKRFITDSLYIYKRITLVVSDSLEYLYSIYISLNLLLWLILL